MQCQRCDKQATVHLTEIVSGEKMERHLCEKCAQKEGVTVKTHVGLGDLLNSMVTAQETANELSELTCPQCQMTWSEFRKHGLLGCPNDYLAFAKPLNSIIERAQEGAANHVGRTPRHAETRLGDQGKLLHLRKQLRTALQKEDYEAAARLRDEIGQLTPD